MASVITNPTVVLQYRASGAGTVTGNSLETMTWITEYGSPMCFLAAAAEA